MLLEMLLLGFVGEAGFLLTVIPVVSKQNSKC